MSVRIAIIVDEPAWRGAGDLRTALRRALRAAFKAEARDGDVNLLLTNDAAMHRFNRDFRGKDKPTNVLSFPAAPNPEGRLGDIAMGHETLLREAEAAGKSFADHAMHLTVHGALHLLGYDHVRAKDAGVMEAKETAILASLGIADPYQTVA